MREKLLLTNNFLHDLATGTWLGIFLVLWRMRVHLSGLDFLRAPLAAVVVRPAMQDLFWWGLGVLGIIIATGAIRLWGEVRWGIGIERPSSAGLTPSWLQDRRLLLVIKHVFLVTVFILGTFLEYGFAWK